MRFSQILYFVAAVSATPLASSHEKANALEARQGTNVAAVILNSVNVAAQAVNTSLIAAQQTIQTAGNNINVQAQALVEADINAIAAALNNAAQTINGAITGAGGNIAAIAATFTTTQINQIILAVGQLVSLLTNLGVRLEVIINNLENVAPTALQAISDELALVQAAIAPFTTPIVNVANAVSAVSATASIVLTGFTALIPGLLNIINVVTSNL